MIKVLIQDSDYGQSLDIVILDERDGKRFIAQPCELIFEEDNKGYIKQSTLRLNSRFKNEFLKAMAEALNKKGIKTENDFKIQGLLEATKKHLEDMRRLVFKVK